MEITQVLPRDAIPSIDDPQFGETYFGEPTDRVLAVEGTPPRAYPVRILNFHEIVNDTIPLDDVMVPIAVTWCPLCGSGIVFDRRVGDRTLTFGVSGKLADDDLVMYDRETESEWKQSTGRCLQGSLEQSRLDIHPATMLSWEAYRSTYPDGRVLQPPEGARSEAASPDDTPARVAYEDRPYQEYITGDGFGLNAHRGTGSGPRSWSLSDLPPKAVVLGIEVSNVAVGFPRPWVLDDGGLVQTRVGERAVTVLAHDGELFAYETPDLTLTWVDGRLQGDETTWDPITGASADGRRVDRVPGRRLFAFTWVDDHGPTAFYRSGRPA